jgi:hypothetical protein
VTQGVTVVAGIARHRVTAPSSRLDALDHRRGAHPLRVGGVTRQALIHEATPGHVRLLDVSRHDGRNAVRATIRT